MERSHIIVMKSVDCLSQSFFMYSVSKNARFDFSQDKKETFHKIVQTFAISAMCFEGQPLNGGYCYDTLKADQVVKSLTREIAPVCQKVRGVIAYLEGLNDGDIFYIISADIPVSERMRSHLAVKAMAMHHNVEDSLRHFDETWGALFGKYRFLSFGRDGCCEYVGEPKKKARVCRFCGRKYPEACYKEIAHAIPDLKAGEVAAAHVHEDMQEGFYVLSGELDIVLDETVEHCKAEDFVFVKCGTSHKLRAVTDVRVMTLGRESII